MKSAPAIALRPNTHAPPPDTRLEYSPMAQPIHLDDASDSEEERLDLFDFTSEPRPSAGLSDEERAALYRDFQPLVRRLIRQYGDTYEQRQDLEGEIYCRFCALLDAFDPGRGVPLRAYLVRKLITSVYTYARSQWRRQKHEISLEASTESGMEVGESSRPTDPSDEWDTNLMQKDLLKIMPQVITKLPLRQRQVIIWRYYESRSYDEIAEMLGVKAATARSLLRHGLNNLRRQIALVHPIID